MNQQQTYSESFKIQLVRDIERGKLTQSSAQTLYKIKGHSTILKWLRKYGVGDYSVSRIHSKRSCIVKDKELLLKNEIKALKQELDDARFKNIVLETFIDVADRELGTDLRKKFGAKPAKR